MRAKSSLTFIVALTALAVFAAVTLLPAAPGGASPGAFVTPVSWSYLPMAIRPLPSPTPTVTPTPIPSWINIKVETFEDAFPNSWVVQDLSPSGGEFYWAKRNCRVFAGAWSGWGVGGGADGGARPCGSTYPDGAYSWMTFGPFSLADASDAEMQFMLWLYSESGYDGLCVGASLDDYNYYVDCYSGDSAGWVPIEFDLTDVYTLGNLLGQPAVWVGFIFGSDGSYTYPDGAHLDNIVLRKFPVTGGAARVESGDVETPANLSVSRAAITRSEAWEVPSPK